MPSLLNRPAQLEVLAYWLVFLSIPILYIATATKWDAKDNKASLLMKITILFLATPLVMAAIAMSPSIYATNSHIIVTIIALYFVLWVIEWSLWPKYTEDSLSTDTRIGQLAIQHFSNITLACLGYFGMIMWKHLKIINQLKLR